MRGFRHILIRDLSGATIRCWSLLLCAACLFLSAFPAHASQVTVFDCRFLVTNGPHPRESLLGDFIIRRHIEDVDPYETTETTIWAEGKFIDEGYFDVTVIPLEGDNVTARSTSVHTTILDGSELIGDSYLDEALTMEKTFDFEGYTIDSVTIIYERDDGTAVDTHLTVPKELDPAIWDPFPGCGQFGCPVQCAIGWRVPGDAQNCGTPNSPNLFCSTGSYIGRIVSVTYEDHEHDHDDGTGNDFTINAGLNDAWVNVDAPLQGLFVTVFPVLKLVFLAWFTFDSEQPPEDVMAEFGAPDQRWVTALGFYDGNRVEMAAELTTGGAFNSSDPLPTQDTEYGTINVEFTNCENGLVEFDFPSAGESGSFNIQRVVNSNVALCETLNSD